MRSDGGELRRHLQARASRWLNDRVSDIKRLENELRTLWEAIQQDVQDENPEKGRPERRQMARSRFIQVVDDVVRNVARE